MPSLAQDLIWPSSVDVLMRVVFLYVGQGESTIVLASSEGGYKVLIIDIHSDEKNGGIDVPRLVKDLIDGKSDSVHAFVNTHPHNDHLCGVTDLSDSVTIDEVWHSGHNPGKDHKEAYDQLQGVIKQVTQRGGKEVKLQGSRTPSAVGEVQYFVLAPAEYVVDDIAEETAEARYQRIHEQCAVLRLGFDSTWVMLTGDADRDAWEKHITSYHEERLPSQVLSAAHHGSRTFFRHDEDEEPFRDALQKIAPDYVVISAPKRSESPFGHPHEDAVREYADQVGDDNVLHTGKMRYSFVCDVFRDGTYQITDDGGELAKAYHVGGNEPENDGGSGGKARQAPAPAVVVTRVDRRPMGTH